MDKKAWIVAMKRSNEGLDAAKKNLVVAKKNVEIVEEQIEERELMAEAYTDKIATFKQ